MIQKRVGDREAGRGMGVETTRRLWRQRRSNSSFVSLAGRTATLPITKTPFFSPVFFGDDIWRGVGR